MDIEEDPDIRDYENKWGRPGAIHRRVRAHSAVPGNYKHYNELASTMYDNAQSYSKSSVSKSSRGEFVRESSVPIERSNYEYTPLESSTSGIRGIKRTTLNEIRELVTPERRNFDDLMELGSYKITIKPTEDSWISPSRFYYDARSQNLSNQTAALLKAYNPNNYPEFIFGKFGLDSKGAVRGRPYSMTSDFANRSLYDYDRSMDESNLYSNRSSSMNRSSSRAYDFDRAGSAFREGTVLRGPNAYRDTPIGPRPSMFKDGVDIDGRGNGGSGDKDIDAYFNRYYPGGKPVSPRISRYNPLFQNYDEVTDPVKSRVNRFSKFFHYYIPKHYGGTPMRGGYLMPSDKTSCIWKY